MSHLDSLDYAKPSSLDNFFGLYNAKSRAPVPLKSIQIEVFLNEHLSQVKYSQKYINETQVRLETEYFFPIASTACFDGFKAKIGNKTIIGDIKEKQIAREEYKSNLDKGNTAAIAEISDSAPDVMKITIGNLDPGAEVDIEFSYIDKIEISMNKFRKFTLHSTLTPRKSPKISSPDLITLYDYPLISSTESASYPWKVSISLVCDEEITFINSPTHPKSSFVKEEKTVYTVTLPEDSKPNKNFVLLFLSGDPKQPKCLITPFDLGHCALVSFFPETYEVEVDDAIAAEASGEGKLDYIDMSTARGEFIFLLDRSGSMEGKKIMMAKEALIAFVLSLPQDSYFNIVSFGDSYANMFFNSRKYDDESKKEAIEKIKEFLPDFGGTNILLALEEIYNSAEMKDYPKTIFLLTDGSVANIKEISNFLKSSRQDYRLFTLGIGNTTSSDLIKLSAEAGKGRYEFVSENEILSNKVIPMLKSALIPLIKNFKLSYEHKNTVAYCVPDPKTMQYIVANEPLEFFLIFNKTIEKLKATSITLEYFNSAKNIEEMSKISLEVKQRPRDEMVIKYGMHRFCKALSKKIEVYFNNEQKLEDIQEPKIKALIEDVKKQLLVNSLKFKILNERTAFFCVLNEGNDATKQIPVEKITVPHHVPDDNEDSSEHSDASEAALKDFIHDEALKSQDKSNLEHEISNSPRSVGSFVSSSTLSNNLIVPSNNLAQMSYQVPMASQIQSGINSEDEFGFAPTLSRSNSNNSQSSMNSFQSQLFNFNQANKNFNFDDLPIPQQAQEEKPQISLEDEMRRKFEEEKKKEEVNINMKNVKESEERNRARLEKAPKPKQEAKKEQQSWGIESNQKPVQKKVAPPIQNYKNLNLQFQKHQQVEETISETVEEQNMSYVTESFQKRNINNWAPQQQQQQLSKQSNSDLLNDFSLSNQSNQIKSRVSSNTNEIIPKNESLDSLAKRSEQLGGARSFKESSKGSNPISKALSTGVDKVKQGFNAIKEYISPSNVPQKEFNTSTTTSKTTSKTSLLSSDSTTLSRARGDTKELENNIKSSSTSSLSYGSTQKNVENEDPIPTKSKGAIAGKKEKKVEIIYPKSEFKQADAKPISKPKFDEDLLAGLEVKSKVKIDSGSEEKLEKALTQVSIKDIKFMDSIDDKKIDETSLRTIMAQQNTEGSWNCDEKNAKVIGVVKSKLVTGNKLALIPDRDKIWITIVILVWIETNFANLKNTWQLVHKKGTNWLKNKGIDYSKSLNDALKILQN